MKRRKRKKKYEIFKFRGILKQVVQNGFKMTEQIFLPMI